MLKSAFKDFGAGKHATQRRWPKSDLFWSPASVWGLQGPSALTLLGSVSQSVWWFCQKLLGRPE
jgi:hypothetical protein